MENKEKVQSTEEFIEQIQNGASVSDVIQFLDDYTQTHLKAFAEEIKKNCTVHYPSLVNCSDAIFDSNLIDQTLTDYIKDNNL